MEDITARMIDEAAGQGDGLAREILTDAARALGTAIGNAANLMNPERFIMGGGVMKAGPFFWDEIRSVARRVAVPQVNFEIVAAALGDDAPLWGAFALAEEAMARS